MLRRRLRLNCSSDEEDDNNQQQHENETIHQAPTVTHQPVNISPPNPNPNPTTSPDATEPVQISDEEFIDVSENLTPPSPPPPPPRPMPLSSVGTTGSPIGDFLWRMGLRLRREWLDSCLRGLESSVPGFSSFGVAEKAKLCFEQFLFTDMNYSGDGVLPPNVGSLHLVDLPGPFVLQVDEIVNISCPLRGRYQDVPPGFKRCLKLSMTDGVQRVFGMEYRPIKDLKVLAPPGFKVAICNVHIRHGLLMLVPEVLEVLGGVVQELDEAQKRLVDEVNKPPRGKRSRTGVVPSLATRATCAAWQLNGANVNGRTNSSMLEDATPIEVDGQGNALVASRTDAGQRTIEQSSFSISVETAVPRASSNVVSHIEKMHIDTVPMSLETAMSNSHMNAVPDVEDIHVVVSRNDTSDRTIERVTTVSTPHSNAVPDVEDIHMVDEVEHPLILSGEREIPFTYLASLSAKWAAMKDKEPSVQGKIRCFLTGVRRFQYKKRVTYELQCYVDDGSLISEILIDHNVVQKSIGHSPVEVSAALSSSDMKTVDGMKEALKQFQILLVNFEGTMLVEINKTSPLPVALEMCQGCTASDAWLLLKRLKFFAPQTPQRRPSDPIDISP